MAPRSSLSATNLAVHHHLQCDLFLHHTYHKTSSNVALIAQPSGLTNAQFERGNDWEAKLLAWLDQRGLLLTIRSTAFTGLDLRSVIDLDDREYFYIAGLSFLPPQDALDKEYLAAKLKPVNFGVFKPDLIEVRRQSVGGPVSWRVIDAKASSVVKTSHLVQIYFYSHCLRLLLPQPYFQPIGNAAVWLSPKSGSESSDPSMDDLKTINLSLVSDSMKQFLFRRLPHLLGLPRASVRWHYNPLCRDCPYDSDCRSNALRQSKIGSMPNISLDQAQVLQSLLVSYREREDRLYTNETSDIEDLHLLFAEGATREGLERDIPGTVRTAKRILGIPLRKSKSSPRSSMLEAALSRKIMVIPRRNFTCPRNEDVAVIISLLQDPANGRMASFCISTFSALPTFKDASITGQRDDLIPALASVITRLLEFRAPDCKTAPRTQFYIFSSNEEGTLQHHLVDAALVADANDANAQAAVRICIGALSEGASLLATSFQPLVLSGALLDFLYKKSRNKSELVLCLQRLGLPTDGTTDRLRARVQDELSRLKGDRTAPATGNDDDRRTEIGQLPRVVVVKRELERLLALPIPGYWDLPECATALLPSDPRCSSDDDIYALFKNGSAARVEAALKHRNRCVYDVLQNMRSRVSCRADGRPNLLINEARVLSANFMDICRHGHLRKLFFMQQFEVLTKLTELWRARIDGCPDAPVLEFRGYAFGQSAAVFEHTFDLISGNVDLPPDKDQAFYEYLLVEDDDNDSLEMAPSDTGIPVEALFDDLSVHGLVFPLNKGTRHQWTEQHPDVQAKLLLANLRDMVVVQGQRPRVKIKTWGCPGPKLIKGRRYRLSPRLVDFNITKVLSTLVELDLRDGTSDPDSGDEVPFLQLITDPRSFTAGQDPGISESFLDAEESIQRQLKRLKTRGSKDAEQLLLKSSQHLAAKRILSSRLAVVWGPPGTGKTYTIALSILRLLAVRNGLHIKGRCIIFLTAMTHAAIQACLSKLTFLIGCYRRVEGLDTRWLDRVKVEHVVRGGVHSGPAASQDAFIYAGTVYQLYNFSKRFSFEADCVIIDEAGQLALSSAALVLRSLGSSGKVVVAGDSEQLAPIFSAQYPILESRLFGSILDCLMHLFSPGVEEDSKAPSSSPISSLSWSSSWSSSQSQVGVVVQLTENFRLNPDLGEFVSTIYSRAFKAQKSQARELAESLQSLRHDGSASPVLNDMRQFLLALSGAMLRERQHLKPPSHHQPKPAAAESSDGPLPISLALIRIQTRSILPEKMGDEKYLRGEAAVAASLVSLLQRCSPKDDIFVATPHRIQRQAVKEALASIQGDVSEALAAKIEGLSFSTERRVQPSGKVTVDTVERLQGSEAAFVICLFSLPTHPATTSGNPAFLLERRRLNVAISRAKTLCILITSDTVLRPPVTVLANAETAKGYAFLRDYQDRAWSGTVEVDLDCL